MVKNRLFFFFLLTVWISGALSAPKPINLMNSTGDSIADEDLVSTVSNSMSESDNKYLVIATTSVNDEKDRLKVNAELLSMRETITFATITDRVNSSYDDEIGNNAMTEKNGQNLKPEGNSTYLTKVADTNSSFGDDVKKRPYDQENTKNLMEKDATVENNDRIDNLEEDEAIENLSLNNKSSVLEDKSDVRELQVELNMNIENSSMHGNSKLNGDDQGKPNTESKVTTEPTDEGSYMFLNDNANVESDILFATQKVPASNSMKKIVGEHDPFNTDAAHVFSSESEYANDEKENISSQKSTKIHLHEIENVSANNSFILKSEKSSHTKDAPSADNESKQETTAASIPTEASFSTKRIATAEHTMRESFGFTNLRSSTTHNLQQENEAKTEPSEMSDIMEDIISTRKYIENGELKDQGHPMFTQTTLPTTLPQTTFFPFIATTEELPEEMQLQELKNSITDVSVLNFNDESEIVLNLKDINNQKNTSVDFLSNNAENNHSTTEYFPGGMALTSIRYEPSDMTSEIDKNNEERLENKADKIPVTTSFTPLGEISTGESSTIWSDIFLTTIKNLEQDKTTFQQNSAGKISEIVKIATTPTTLEDSMQVKTKDVTSTNPLGNENPILEQIEIYNDKYVSGNNSDMIAAVQFLHYHDKASSEQCFKLVNSHWNYATNLTEENKKKQLSQTLEYSLFHKEAWKNATSFAWKSFNDTLLRRWFKNLSILGTAALPEQELNEFNRLKAEMKNTYSTAKVCKYSPPQLIKIGSSLEKKKCDLNLEPELQRILTKSRDYDELLHVWKEWRNVAGRPIRDKFLRFVNLSNEAARLNGFTDTGDMWRESYESKTFQDDLSHLWEQLRPLYEHLHAYVRRRLIRLYGTQKILEDGPIPAHLFGNMWAQSWVSLMEIAQPYPEKPSVDVTSRMETMNMTALEMFQISEEFFVSLGLKSMPEEFWKHSLIEKPRDREIICHASAWDFCNGKDYRIKQCTDITMEDLITVHHEMGHIQYFLQYTRQPNVFREGANPGFHEAIGDVLALSVSTPKHLKSIGLLKEVADDPEGDLNFLLRTALEKVAFLPSGYIIDLWRWGVFSGEIKPEEMNSKWWDLRLKYQGVCPPVKRTDADFDPGAKFHIPGNVPYIRYFVSFVIQFQFHKVLCDAAGHNGPLYKCDIYRSRDAGQILSQVMELGSSEHWSEAMKIMTGGATNKMDAQPIMEYFEPLLIYLQEQNQNETIGWRSSDATICP